MRLVKESDPSPSGSQPSAGPHSAGPHSAGPHSAGPHSAGGATRAGTTLDDHELLARVREGDESSASAFCVRLAPRVRGTIRRLLGAADSDREDLEQLTMVAIVEGLDRYRAECSLDAWASSIAAHVVYKHIRRRTLERKHFDFTCEDDDGESPMSFEGALIARDLMHRIRGLLFSMDPDRAWAFLLHDLCHLDLREVASVTGVSVAAAQKRLVRGRAELHERIAADPELASAFQREKVIQ